LTAQQQALITELKADNAALRQTVQTSTTRTIEVVALFIAAIAFAVGSLQVTLVGTLSLKDRAILLGIFGVGLLLFAVVIVGATWTITRVRKRYAANGYLGLSASEARQGGRRGQDANVSLGGGARSRQHVTDRIRRGVAKRVGGLLWPGKDGDNGAARVA
jgi:hypothetical protein